VYGKVFGSLWEGSMRGRPGPQLVFVYLIANADARGIVDLHPKVIMDATGLSEADVRTALDALEGPDHESRTPEMDGRRIVRLDEHRAWGWLIVNHEKYMRLQDIDHVRQLTRDRVRRHREKRNGSVTVTPGNGQVTQGNDTQTQTQTQTQRQKTRPAEALAIGQSALPLKARRGVKRTALLSTEKLPEGELTAAEVFDQIFWPEYPRKVAKAAARAQWMRLKLKDTDDETMVQIMAGLRRDMRTEWKGRELDTIPHASTWLHQRRWEG
jgi:hypothetical protein